MLPGHPMVVLYPAALLGQAGSAHTHWRTDQAVEVRAATSQLGLQQKALSQGHNAALPTATVYQHEDTAPLQQHAALLEEDTKLRQEDARIRQEEEELRKQNEQIRREILRMSSRSGIGGFWSQVVGPADDPLASSPMKAITDVPDSTVNGTAANGGRSSSSRLVRVLTIGGFITSIILVVAYKVYDAINDKDMDGDGDVDFSDFMRHCTCNMSREAARRLALVLVVSGSGFAFLWWMGVMQPFLGQLLVYAYILTVLGAFLSIVFAEIWGNITSSASVLIETVNRLERFFHDGVEDVGQAVKNVENMVGLGHDGNAKGSVTAADDAAAAMEGKQPKRKKGCC